MASIAELAQMSANVYAGLSSESQNTKPGSSPLLVGLSSPLWISADRVLSAVDDVLNRILQSPSLSFCEFHDFGASDLGQH